MGDRTTVITTIDNISHIVDAAMRALAEHRGFELDEEDWAIAGRAAGRNILAQINLHAFASDVEADLAELPTTDVPHHRTEFGL